MRICKINKDAQNWQIVENLSIFASIKVYFNNDVSVNDICRSLKKALVVLAENMCLFFTLVLCTFLVALLLVYGAVKVSVVTKYCQTCDKGHLLINPMNQG